MSPEMLATIHSFLLHLWSNQIPGTILSSLMMNCIYRGWGCIFGGSLCWNYVQQESKCSIGKTQRWVWGESSCVSSWTNKRASKKKTLSPNTSQWHRGFNDFYIPRNSLLLGMNEYIYSASFKIVQKPGCKCLLLHIFVLRKLELQFLAH